MANDEHLSILRQGVETWNKWRIDNPGVVPELQGADLTRLDLRSFNFKQTWLYRADVKEANLEQASLDRANLQLAALPNANLRGASLLGTKLFQSDLTGADLSGADLSDADARHAVLDKCNLHGTALFRTSLEAAFLRGTHFDGALFGGTFFGDVWLVDAEGLERAVHLGPSTIGVETFLASVGRVPESFFLGVGIAGDLVGYARARAPRASSFPSCFISYSSRDPDFTQLIHQDLLAKGVPCWLASENMKIGDKILDRLVQSIRLHDKLLLVLSENSIDSEWVEDEVTTAFEEERKRGRTVLFPVRLDDGIFTTHEPWAAKVRQRHIGDFTNWKDHDAYRKAFERLLRDLET